jgi:hypothetical protein
MEAVLEQKQVWKNNKIKKNEKPVGFFAGIFGCWHKELSRPFTTQKESYRVCTHCGARRHFDPETLETYGQFYFPLEARVTELERR